MLSDGGSLYLIADCHMGKSNNQSSHWFTSPLKLGKQMCERCHVNDAAARLQRVITVQDTVMNRAKTVENNLDAVLTKIEALKADPNFDQAKLLQAKEAFMRGLFFWEWTVVSENSSGFHNSDEAAANLQAAEAEIAKAKPLLGL